MFVAWCSSEKTDVYEVKTKQDFDSCTNMNRRLSDKYDDAAIRGFAVRPGKTRYFVSKSQCKDGVKLRIIFDKEKCEKESTKFD